MSEVSSFSAKPTHALHNSPAFRLFTPVLRFLWIALLTVTIFMEVIPIPLMAPVPFYLYCAVKGLIFFIIGFFAPLSFWRFNALNRGILLAAISAACVETLQGVLRGSERLHAGHSFHWYELVVKLAVIFAGFAFALNARYDSRISLGPLQIRLLGDYPPA